MTEKSVTSGSNEHNDTGRLEAFSDGVFAVAITLLALGLAVPTLDQARHVQPVWHFHGLAAALLRQWPSYLTYTLSFLTILIMWVNHHALFKLIRRADHLFLLLNGLLLLIVTMFPFATLLLATYLGQPQADDRKAAMVVYAVLTLVLGLTFNFLLRYATRAGQLVDAVVEPERLRRVRRQFSVGPPMQMVAVALAFVSADASLILIILMTIFFALPSTLTRSNSA